MIAAFANHLWQSTLVAGVAALLALALRKQHPRTRYRIWLATSVKFMIPFSLLVWAGARVGWRTAPAPLMPKFMDEIAQPFAPPVPAIPARTAAMEASDYLWTVLAAVWLCGFAAVAFSWLRRWRRVRRVLRASKPVDLAAPIETRILPALIEPGVVGLFRPVLLLPDGLLGCLTPAQLGAILQHELCHVRRRDNLCAAIHMVVEAIFWFHPLVCWIGARLVEERERACDEDVLRLGVEPEVYAEGILKTCQFYLESPLMCVCGVAGSSLRKRIEQIMTHRIVHALGLGKKLMLAAAGFAAIVGPIAIGIMNAPQGRAQPAPLLFEVASIKPSDPVGRPPTFRIEPGGRLVATGLTLKLLIQQAYGVRDSQISGGPGWLDSQSYDVSATADNEKNYTPEQFMAMIQALLADRFELTLHREIKEVPGYALTVGKNGQKFRESVNPTGPPGVGMGRGQVAGRNLDMAGLARALS